LSALIYEALDVQYPSDRATTKWAIPPNVVLGHRVVAAIGSAGADKALPPADRGPGPPSARTAGDSSIAGLNPAATVCPDSYRDCSPLPLILANSFDCANLAGFSVLAGYSGCALYNEKEQSTDSSGTDLWE
jgi:hypothetical protein